jgi:SAM-dependent methyltransferase
MSSSVHASRHWDDVYGARASAELGWYEPVPSTLEFVTANTTPTSSVIDVGGGDGGLAEELLDRGYGDLTVVDLSEVALDRAQERLGARAAVVTWVRADVTEFVPNRTWDLWHDRAAFHFLVDLERRDRYCRVAASAVRRGGVLVVATFSTDGPDQCAGLPVARYDIDSLPAAFAPEFAPVSVGPVKPRSSIGDQRPYIVAVLTCVFDA